MVKTDKNSIYFRGSNREFKEFIKSCLVFDISLKEFLRAKARLSK